MITKQVRAGYLFLSAVLFEPPEEFWDIPSDFIEVQRKCEAWPAPPVSIFRITKPRRKIGSRRC